MSSLFKTTFLGSSASYSGIIPSGGDSPTVTSSGSSFDRVTKLRSNSVNDTLSTTSSSMASDMAKSGEAAESRNFASNFQLMRQNALRHAKKSFKSHHNLAYGADGDDTDERSNQNEISKEGFY